MIPQYSNEEDAYEDIERNYWEGNVGFTEETRTRYKWALDPQSGGGINAWRRSSEIYTYNRRVSSSQFFASVGMDRRFAGLEKNSSLNKWPTEIHNLILEEAFKDILSSKEIEILKQASYDMDKFQKPEESFIHAMAAPGQSISDAKMRMENFIKAAQQIFIESEGFMSYYALGSALHPIMDATSPAHIGFQMWRGIGSAKGLAEGGKHLLEESTITKNDFDLTVKSVRNFYFKSLQMKKSKK